MSCHFDSASWPLRLFSGKEYALVLQHFFNGLFSSVIRRGLIFVSTSKLLLLLRCAQYGREQNYRSISFVPGWKRSRLSSIVSQMVIHSALYLSPCFQAYSVFFLLLRWSHPCLLEQWDKLRFVAESIQGCTAYTAVEVPSHVDVLIAAGPSRCSL